MDLKIAIIIFLLLTGCSPQKTDSRLSRIETVSLSLPKEALDSLNAIEYEKLSDEDRHLYDFLKVKISDKAYVRHVSDSLILGVIEYETSHKYLGRYTEALYYGGRVYSDLGDFPTAMKFYQDALDEISPTPDGMDLTANILSQYARLLNSLRLYEEAVPLLKRAIKIDQQLKDTTNLIYDLHLLGNTYMKSVRYEDAEDCIRKSIYLCKNKPIDLQAKTRMNMAILKHHKHQLDSALIYIRQVPNEVKALTRNVALGHASKIYLDANILDTAFLYAREILKTQDNKARETAYLVLLSDKLIPNTPNDTLVEYIKDYRRIIEEYQNRNETELTINQQSFYNYQLHVKEKEKLAKDKTILLLWIVELILVILVLIIAVLQYRNRKNANIIKLQAALNNIKALKKDLAKDFDSKETDFIETAKCDVITTSLTDKKEVELDLRKQLQDELMSVYKNATAIPKVPDSILKSEVLAKLQDAIGQNKMVNENNPLWHELEQVVLEASPEFRVKLNLLAFGNIKADDLHVALMMKCGVKPKHMSILLGKTNGALVSRRTSLCVKVLDDKYKADVINYIIRLL